MAAKKKTKPEEMGKRKQALIRIDNELMKDVKILAVKQEKKFNNLVIDALKEYLQKYTSKK
ncbi:MAG: hypothetical protein IBX72_06895 [Nitrospirae bacterium]|nr:hypothetical protein [Nitrospirota bacterium]